jgi:hypothetical protein
LLLMQLCFCRRSTGKEERRQRRGRS